MNLNQVNRRKEIVKKIRPLLVLLILLPVVTFMMYPMVNMSPRDLHVGIVSIDEGAQFEQGKVNLGDKIIKNITDPDSSSAASGKSPVVWEVYDAEADAKAALKDKDIYAYLLIPKDFSGKQTQQLDAFNNLSTALGKMSEGTGKMSAGISQASGKLTQLPKAFRNLATASDNLGKAAQGGQAILNGSSSAINANANAITNNDAAVNNQINGVQNQLDALAEKVNSGASAEEIQSDLNTIQQSLDGITANNSQSVNAIKGATGALTGQEASASAIFQNIAKAETGMS